MSRRLYCKACSFNRAGVRTRIEIPHAEGCEMIPRKENAQYEPTREELDKYLAKLKELMEVDKQDES